MRTASHPPLLQPLAATSENPSSHVTRMGVVVCDRQLHVLLVNAKATELLQYIEPRSVPREPLRLPQIFIEFCKNIRPTLPANLRLTEPGVHSMSRIVCSNDCSILLRGFSFPLSAGDKRQDVLLLLEKELAGNSLVSMHTPPTYAFTDQQQKVIAGLTRGLSNKEIANHLLLSEYTVKDHLKRIMKKMNCSTRVSIVARLTASLQGNGFCDV